MALCDQLRRMIEDEVNAQKEYMTLQEQFLHEVPRTDVSGRLESDLGADIIAQIIEQERRHEKTLRNFHRWFCEA